MILSVCLRKIIRLRTIFIPMRLQERILRNSQSSISLSVECTTGTIILKQVIRITINGRSGFLLHYIRTGLRISLTGLSITVPNVLLSWPIQRCWRTERMKDAAFRSKGSRSKAGILRQLLLRKDILKTSTKQLTLKKQG